MTKRLLFRSGILAAFLMASGFLLSGGTPAVRGQAATITYTVEITNLTDGQPLTPPLLAAHSPAADVYNLGQAATAPLQAIAENGNLEPMVMALEASDAVSSVVMGSGPVMPGQTASLTIEAPQGALLTWVSMLICTNDGFTGVDSWMLEDGAVTTTNAYDAGTEVNTEDFADMVPPCQALVGVSSNDTGTGSSNPALAEDGVIAMHEGVQGGLDLTASHMWEGPVAEISVSLSMDREAPISPPDTGSGGLAGPQADGLYPFGAVAVLLALVSAALIARRSSRV